MIIDVNDPTWDPKKREWVINYIIEDASIGRYTQTITCEALISANNIYKELLQKQKMQKCK